MTTHPIPDQIDFPQVQALIEAFNRRFPDGNTPYQMLARLCEEGGELAEQVNQAETQGGLHDNQRASFAKEIEDVIRALLTIRNHYQLAFHRASFAEIYELLAPRPITSPYQFISQLTETMGWISKKINHAKGMGIKHTKYGSLDLQAFAQSIEQALLLAFAITQYYGLEEDVQTAFRGSFTRMHELGFV